MDFWSRLIANTPLAENARRDAAKDPVRRLRRFEKEYGQLLQAWRNSSSLAQDYDAAEEVEIRLQELTNMLGDETRRPLPHPCIAFSASKQMYLPVAKIATTSYNEWIIKEAVLFFATLVESEEEAFVESDAFAASLTNLMVKITGANSIRLGSDTEARVVELAFNITTKIRLQPTILAAWFKTRRAAPQPDDRSQDGRDGRDKFEGRTQKQDFPLFYVLVDYIQHEGKVGDFARTGLLYIIEAASNSVELEQWIVESDLSTLMATGLGALYSQLSGKLVIDYLPQDLPPILAFSDYQTPVPAHEIVPSTAPEFQAHLETFLSHLVFWQDVLNHCKSVEVKSTLLEHFQIIFLQQLLYPSLLESSDNDGGSSVAVLTYLRQILESLDHPDMINLILHYLLGLPDVAASEPQETSTSVSKARQRKSMDLATMMASSKADDPDDHILYTLVDLILACVRSPSHQTINVTLQLVSAILKRHHRYAVTTLIRTENLYGDIPHRTAGAHEQEIEFLMSLAGSIGGQDDFDAVYESILKDTTSRIDSHPCFLRLTAINASNYHTLPTVPDSLPGAPRDVRPHTIRPDDPLLSTMLDHLESFFLNPVETNLSVTETLFDLAVCGFMNVEGWLLRSPDTYIYDTEDSYQSYMQTDEIEDPLAVDKDDLLSDDPKKLDAVHKCQRRPVWSPSDLPRLLSILQQLSDQVDAFRGSIPRFGDLLQQRREAFQIADAPPSQAPTTFQPQQPLGNPGSAPGQEPSSAHTSRSSSPTLTAGLESFARRLLKDLDDLGTPSRSNSPRNNLMAGSSGGYGIGTPSFVHKPLPATPRELPLGYDTPSKSGTGVARSFSPANSQKRDEDPIKASQAAAFQEIDQQIMARKVGLPSTNNTVEPIPLRLGGKIEDNPQQHGSPHTADEDMPSPPPAKMDSSAADNGHGARVSVMSPERTVAPEDKRVSVSHVLTNIIVLQSFLFELAAVIQVRAGFFDDEVRYA